jgi:hypothetical protein
VAHSSTSPQVQPEFPDGSAESENYVELGDGLWLSLTSGYRFAVDRPYLNALPTETAQRLYSYLAKKDYKSRFYEERVVSIGRRLGLSKTIPADIRASLEPACKALQQPLGSDRKVFLRDFLFQGSRGDMKLLVETNRERDLMCDEQVATQRAQQIRELRSKLANSR